MSEGPESQGRLAAGSAEQGEQAHEVALGVQRLRRELGMARIHLGAYLCVMKDQDLWRAYANSWEAYIATLNMNVSGARQFMTVARKLVFELGLDEKMKETAAMAGMAALEKACRVMNKANKEEIVGILSSLSEKDAVQRIIELSAGRVGEDSHAVADARVLKALRGVYQLPPDLQNQVVDTLNERRNGMRGGGR